VDERCVTPLVSGLWVAASVTFDTRDMSAQVVLQAAYSNRFLAVDAAGSFEYNMCTAGRCRLSLSTPESKARLLSATSA
jgi:hypothetical protein